MEQYQVVTRGKLVAGQSRVQVEAALGKLNAPAAMISKIMSGKVVGLKNSLSWQQAQSWRSKFRSLGLETELRLQLSPELFHIGLRQNPKNDKPKQLERYFLDKRQLLPVLIALPGRKPLQGKQYGTLQFHSYYWSPLLLLVAALLIGSSLQSYLMRTAIAYLQWSAAASVGGILVLVLAVVLLPRLLQPRASFSLQRGSESLHCVEALRLFIGEKRYRVYDQHHNLIGEIAQKRKAAHYLSLDSGLQWKARDSAGLGEMNALDDMSEGLLSNTALSTVLDAIAHLRRVRSFFAPKPKPEQVDWAAEQAQIIQDAQGTELGRVYQQPYPAVELNGEAADLPLLAFATVLCRPAWL